MFTYLIIGAVALVTSTLFLINIKGGELLKHNKIKYTPVALLIFQYGIIFMSLPSNYIIQKVIVAICAILVTLCGYELYKEEVYRLALNVLQVAAIVLFI